MFFLATLFFFLLWTVWVIRKGPLSWHTVLGIYFITLFVTDIGDVPFDHLFNLYDLHLQMSAGPDAEEYLALILSDGMIFPLIAIVFCYYAAKYRRPWLLSVLFAAMMGIIEYFFVQSGYMVYHRWNHWITPVVTFVLLRLLASFARRFVFYAPPVPYRLLLFCAAYTITALPGAIMNGRVLKLYQFQPGIFAGHIIDDWFISVSLSIFMGVLAAVFAPLIRRQGKIFFFLGLGLVSFLFSSLMYTKGYLLYHHWSHLLNFVRYLTPYLLVYLYDRWESDYRARKAS